MAADEPTQPAARASLWGRLRGGLRRTQTQLRERLEAAVGHGRLDDETLEGLEEALLSADVGVETTMELIDTIRADFDAGRGDLRRLHERLSDEIAILLLDAPQPPASVPGPRLTLVVGVNGVGKTTSIAKLAARSLDEGRSVLLVAADTFRAAAIEQLMVWGERLDIAVVRQQAGADPAAVVFDGLQAARARKIDEVIVDTAGRLHTKKNLMEELAKIGRVVAREAPERSRRNLLVLDATTGQNAVQQALEFSSVVDLDGIFLAKLDGTAKGGIVVALARNLRMPVVYLGVGEGVGDLVPFHARDFTRALLGDGSARPGDG